MASLYWGSSSVGSVQPLQFGLQRLEIPDGVLERRVGTQGLQLHQVPTDVVQAHVGEAAPGRGERERETLFKRLTSQITPSTAPTRGREEPLPVVGWDSAGSFDVSEQQHVDALHQVKWFL